MSGEPFPKSRQLARGERRYRRRVASPAQWQRIIAAKLGPCRVCVSPEANGGYDTSPKPIEFHHLIARQRGGDDVPDNLVPLCAAHHLLVTEVDLPTVRLLAANLTEAERRYVNRKLGRGEAADLCECGHWSRHHTIGKHNGCGHCRCEGFVPA